MGWKSFNDRMALFVMACIITLWILNGIDSDGKPLVSLNDTVIGATIMAFTMVLTYYFRRKPPNGNAN